MPNGLKQLLDSTFGPPQEGIRILKELTTGETSRRLDKLLLRIERISRDSSNLSQVIELLKLVEKMSKDGTLDKLNSLLQSIPKGKTGQTLVVELRKAITEIAPRLDKLSNLAKVLLKKEE